MNLTLPNRIFGGYIFDCDGTLANTMPLHYHAWARVVRESGGEFPRDLFYSWGGRPGPEIVASLNELYRLDLDPGRTVDLKEEYFVELLPEVQPIEPVVEIARRMLAHGRPVAVASGGHRRYVELTLLAIGIKDLFDVIVCAEDYARGKPDPAVFLTTAVRLGVSPGECVVFEDSPAGIEAARAAGMHCVIVPTIESHRP
ncbi:haloacid dehalogenase superfamily protein, subfamily IA, variant 3 with third motif having DD or ED [Opitutaceae bacterium TAV1]|nr:haloacid dehalogenase superfamily protein, subfamily IA, variant 3 with third motif having DD or ED [Opitutaceae bacterium TAV1]